VNLRFDADSRFYGRRAINSVSERLPERRGFRGRANARVSILSKMENR